MARERKEKAEGSAGEGARRGQGVGGGGEKEKGEVRREEMGDQGGGGVAARGASAGGGGSSGRGGSSGGVSIRSLNEEAMESDFMRIAQHPNETITEYEERFARLSRFASHVVQDDSSCSQVSRRTAL
ncbi:hypothetical protein RJ640_028811 [Escallonia rubra]|uniref:Retrotransposon gag domain-containing protein n=1 Tax=Escallonia rubra TaxID=112253 RepID=A0AA88U2U4_9ASTE|nr:hypothetical protein RJ640_028811 [Escallonia rubra]